MRRRGRSTVDEQECRQELLLGKKSERIIFAVTPELKKAVADMAARDCKTVSAFITSMLADEAVRRTK